MPEKGLESLVNLFTEDATFAVEAHNREVVSRGRAKLKKMYESVVGDVQPQPYIHTHVVELHSANSATGRCHVELRIVKADEDRPISDRLGLLRRPLRKSRRGMEIRHPPSYRNRHGDTAEGFHGMSWRTRPGTSILNLIGEAWTPDGDLWKPSSLDLKTGEVTGGSYRSPG